MSVKSLFQWILAGLMLIGAEVFATAGNFRAGAAVRVITPDPLLPVSGGVGTPKKATEKRGDLFVRALVLENGNTRVAIVGIDNLGWPSALGNQSRALIRGIPPENVLIGATHTHSAPDAYGFPDAKGETAADPAYLERCVRLLAEAVNEAVERLAPAALKIAVGEAKGKIAYNYYAEKLYDPRCGVIQAVAAENPQKVLATLVNYAIHPEIIGSKKGILSPDLCGPLYERIEKETGGIAIFINGAQGGMVTADNRREGGTEAGDWEECRRIGYLLAGEALRIVKPAVPVRNPALANTAGRLTLPVASEMMRYILKNSPVSRASGSADSVTTQVNLLTVGPAQLLTIPGEALPNIGYYLKRKMPTKYPFLFGLTNDAFGYILTKEDFNSFERYRYISETSLGEQTGPLFTAFALDLIEKAPRPSGE